jgi:hypothetical protein
MYSGLPEAILLLHAVVSTAVVAQDFDEDSIPEPTQFSVVASDETADMIVVGSPSSIDSDDSKAEIVVVEVVTSDGSHQSGVRILLKHAGQLDYLYLDASQVSRFRDELASFELRYGRGETCEAIGRCVHGIARCRPSQAVQQAFCLSFYSTPDGKQGVSVSTPRYLFIFPSTEPSVFVSAINAAIGELNLREESARSGD